jgi:hypothetical protein
MSTNQQGSGLIVLARTFWMLPGPALLFLSAYVAATGGGGWLSPASVTFLIVLAMVVAARCVDPQTAEGAPATTADKQQFAARAITAGLIIWAVAISIGNS